MVTVHHLENSRSQRILWLLEELGVTYAIERYGRDKQTSLAPPVQPAARLQAIVDRAISSGLQQFAGQNLRPDQLAVTAEFLRCGRSSSMRLFGTSASHRFRL